MAKFGVVTKSVFGEGSTEHAQGGVAVVLSDDDDIFSIMKIQLMQGMVFATRMPCLHSLKKDSIHKRDL